MIASTSVQAEPPRWTVLIDHPEAAVVVRDMAPLAAGGATAVGALVAEKEPAAAWIARLPDRGDLLWTRVFDPRVGGMFANYGIETVIDYSFDALAVGEGDRVYVAAAPELDGELSDRIADYHDVCAPVLCSGESRLPQGPRVYFPGYNPVNALSANQSAEAGGPAAIGDGTLVAAIQQDLSNAFGLEDAAVVSLIGPDGAIAWSITLPQDERAPLVHDVAVLPDGGVIAVGPAPGRVLPNRDNPANVAARAWHLGSGGALLGTVDSAAWSSARNVNQTVNGLLAVAAQGDRAIAVGGSVVPSDGLEFGQGPVAVIAADGRIVVDGSVGRPCGPFDGETSYTEWVGMISPDGDWLWQSCITDRVRHSVHAVLADGDRALVGGTANEPGPNDVDQYAWVGAFDAADGAFLADAVSGTGLSTEAIYALAAGPDGAPWFAGQLTTFRGQEAWFGRVAPNALTP